MTKSVKKNFSDLTQPSKVLIPILLGLAVVGYMLYTRFDIEQFKTMSWNGRSILFFSLAIGVCVLRHIILSLRLRLMSDDHFSFKKSVQLMFIWEFAAAISPTSIGGAATAIIFLAQEKLSAARSMTIVLYSVVLESLYFLVSILIALIIIGPNFINPDVLNYSSSNAYNVSFYIIILFMLAYGLFFFYGLFISPQSIKKFLFFIGKARILKRWRSKIEKTANDIINSSRELKSKKINYHFKNFVLSGLAWICKFLTVPLIIFAVIQQIDPTLFDTVLLTFRNQSMYVITAFTPTPGGSGFAEVLFDNFFSDYISLTAATIIAILWRLITYYFYLFSGFIVTPLWVKEVMKNRKTIKNKAE